jgi:glucan phosphoethanolaminetransferase (alkaline phosphatase superfamily)
MLGSHSLQVGYLFSVKAAVNIVLLMVIIPLSLKVWLKRHPNMQTTADFLGAQFSLVLACVGALFLGLAGTLWIAITSEWVEQALRSLLTIDPGLMIYGLSSGSLVFIFSLVKSPVVSAEGDSTSGRDFSSVVMVRTTGTLIGTPLFAALWIRGFSVGGGLLGLPYFVASVIVTSV